MVSAVPPALMKGSGRPVTGMSAVTTMMLMKAWATSQVVSPQASRPENVQALVREHLGLIDALKRSDARRAERLMVEHVRRVRDTIFRLLD